MRECDNVGAIRVFPGRTRVYIRRGREPTIEVSSPDGSMRLLFECEEDMRSFLAAVGTGAVRCIVSPEVEVLI